MNNFKFVSLEQLHDELRRWEKDRKKSTREQFLNYLDQNCGQPLDLINYNDYDYGQHYVEVLYENVIAPQNLTQDETDSLLNIACKASDLHLQKMLEGFKN